MKDSLERTASTFEGLHQAQVLALLDVLRESELRTKEYVEKRYLDHAPKFETTLRFLTEIGAVQQKNSLLSITQILPEESAPFAGQDLTGVLISLILRRRSRYRSEMFRYLKRFQVTSGQATHRPTVEERSAESPVRNFLMELRVIEYDSSEDRYVVSPEYNALYAQAKHNPHSVSPYALVERLEEQEGIGFSAEIAVVSYERQRVGSQLAHRVDHVALRNVAAGYDIQSVSVCVGNKTLPRYVEVKAVPSGTFRFYWTSNEVNVAKSFGSWYYLYLLPVDRGESFDVGRLRIVRDPYSTVLGSPSEWVVDKDVIQCSLRATVEAKGSPPGDLQYD